jgi:cytochrome c biogenesis protein CcmG/thiol:disulfide interchange protein DsbE
MRRFAVPGLIAAVAAALLAVLAFGIAHDGGGNALAAQVKRGQQPVAPDSTMALPVLGQSAKQTLKDYRGRYVMVSFFAGWCDACQADAGSVKLAEQMLAAHGGTVLGITYQDSTADAASYMRRYKLSYPVLHDSADNLAQGFGVTGVPETFIINPAGKVIAARTYQLTDDWVATTLGHVLGSST